MIPRIQLAVFAEKVAQNKLVFLQGPRKVGKRTLIESTFESQSSGFQLFDCSQKKVRKEIEANSISSQTPYVVLYEAQYLSNLDTILEKVLMGEINATVVVSCSYIPKVQPELLEAIRMAGLEINLFAPSFYEAAQHFGLPEENRLLEERLIYGNYPEVLADLPNAEQTLNEIIQDAVFTKLSSAERINKGEKLIRMLQVLAFSIGDAVSYNEVAERCGLDNETVERYIKLLEDAFLLYRLPSYYHGHRYELKKSNAIYFADNGVRNVLINNFNPTYMRNDMNELWRNYVISERMKWLKMNQLEHQTYFWKTHTNQQMDFVERTENGTFAYKTDWEKKKKVKLPKSFSDAYPEIKVSVLNRATYWKFLTQKK